jgi:predicted ATPase
MIKLLEAKNYRSLQYISCTLAPFNVLIGANATGKSTFLDVIQFMSDIVNIGIDKAIQDRAAYFDELTFAGKGGDIEFAIEVGLPETISKKFNDKNFDTIRYEIRFGKQEESNENSIKDERVTLLSKLAKREVEEPVQHRIEFPELIAHNNSVLIDKYNQGKYKKVITKKPGGNHNFYIETKKVSGKGWTPSFKFGIKKSALGNLPEDETIFPASTWLKSFLQQGVQIIALDYWLLRKPSPSGLGLHFKRDGSNIPWVIEDLKKNAKKFTQWLEHIQTALPDIEDVFTVEREEDRSRYLKIRYRNNIEVPSWLVSDGTLRLLALTILAYAKNISGVFLIEEPENGIHPKAIEAVYQSLTSVYSAQILVASHSTVILSMLEPKTLLCFGKTKEGVTDIVEGNKHPKLRDWKGNPNLYLLFASGILS